jgi:hypothetical protein
MRPYSPISETFSSQIQLARPIDATDILGEQAKTRVFKTPVFAEGVYLASETIAPDNCSDGYCRCVAVTYNPIFLRSGHPFETAFLLTAKDITPAHDIFNRTTLSGLDQPF